MPREPRRSLFRRSFGGCLVFVSASAALAVPPGDWDSTRFGDVVSVPGSGLTMFAAIPIDLLGLLACAPSCEPIPFQVDERDA